jgi:glycosyltransferase involved in cell wall biosynthesis
MTVDSSTRAAIVVNHPAQYFAPAFRAVEARDDVNATIYYWVSNLEGSYDSGFGRHVKWDTDLHSGYEWFAPESDGRWWQKARQTYKMLSHKRPEAVICFGWRSPVVLVGAAYCAMNHVPFVLYGDTNGRVAMVGVRQQVRRAVLRILFHQAAGALTTGVANSKFYLSHGMAPEKLHKGVMPIAVDDFVQAFRRRNVNIIQDGVRQFVIGYAGKLVHHKGVDELLQAAALLPPTDAWEVWIVGDGPERSTLEALAAQLKLKDRCRFLGFKNSKEIPEFLAAMDVLVMPSRFEPRGLVAIEAMAAGAVPIVSTATGVWGDQDAVEEGVTGFVYPNGNQYVLAEKLRELMHDPELVSEISSHARARACEYGPDAFAASVAGVTRAIRVGGRNVSPHVADGDAGGSSAGVGRRSR